MRHHALILGISALLLPLRSALAEPLTRVDELLAMSERFRQELEAARPPLYHELLRSRDPIVARLNAASGRELVYVDERGRPVYYMINNLNAAKTISTNRVWPGGGSGFSLDGSSTALGRLGLWDAGACYLPHQEFGGRATQMDGAGAPQIHCTHVAGTMIASGVRAVAKGMSPQAHLATYDWTADKAEMAAAAAVGMRVSNHSYGPITGWQQDAGDWYWWGDVTIDPVEDYYFGFYSSFDEDLDEIAVNAPYYLICFSAGNDRVQDGPTPGGAHFVLIDGNWVSSNDVRDPDGGTDGYDSISWKKTAKNILTVGSVQDIPGGYTQPSDVVMTPYSCWGPTDDGRIKPDLVANGVQVFSASRESTDAYVTLGGTSMATPCVAGSANLIAEYFTDSHGSDPTSATVKALLLQSADEAGPADGPDYRHGWGLLNTLSAAQLVQADSASPGHVQEGVLADAAVHVYELTTTEAGPFRVTLVWTDPPGTPPPASLDPTNPMLVNDLDVRLEDLVPLTSWEPWTLDPANPSNPATPGDNVRDNVERIDVASLPAGQYVVRLSHKGVLVGTSQSYSLVSSTPLAFSPPTSVDPGNESAFARVRIAPNPFRGSTRLSFSQNAAGEALVRVFDVSGAQVARLSPIRSIARERHVEWDGRDSGGRPVPSGVYFFRVEAAGESFSEKIVLIRD